MRRAANNLRTAARAAAAQPLPPRGRGAPRARGRGGKAAPPTPRHSSALLYDDRDNQRAGADAARRRRGKAAAPPPPTRIAVGRRGLTVRQLAALGGASAPAVLQAARALEPHAHLDTPLPAGDLELLVDELALPLAIEGLPPLYDARHARASAGAGARPVVAVMGHVDHGKTTLLDALRGGAVAAGEAGGITQAIGAFEAHRMTFIDTPGHAAFAAMRARGSAATDVVVLVVAADDGVMPQTLEALRHARAAGVPVVVAINKMDVSGADPDRVRAQLLEMAALNSEQTGGDVQCVEVSAKSGLGLPALLEAVALQGELVLAPEGSVPPGTRLVCIESNRDRARGDIATVVVRSGTLRAGDAVLFQDDDVTSGELYGRVRSLVGVDGEQVQEAGPGTAVGVVGIGRQMPPGSIAIVVDNEKQAKRMSREMIARNAQVAATIEEAERKVEAFADAEEEQEEGEEEDDGDDEKEGEEGKEQDAKAGKATLRGALNVVIKGDVQGSADAVANCLRQLATADYRVRVLAAAPGNVTAGDVARACATAKLKKATEDALIVAFGVRVPPNVAREAKRYGVGVIEHNLIYHVEDDVRQRIEVAGDKWRTKEQAVGTAKVVRVFEDGAVAGCSVTDGKLLAGAFAKVWRYPEDGSERVCVHEGTLNSLKHFAKDIRAADKGSECGLGFGDWSAFSSGDVVECLRLIKGANVA